MARNDQAGQILQNLKSRGLIVGSVAALGLLAGWFLDTESFYRSYLVAYVFWIGIPLGSLALLMLQHMVGGRWGFTIRSVLEASTRTFPLMALLFLPIVLGMGSLYEWTHADVVAQDEILSHKAAYLNVPFFLARAVIYFGLWTLLTMLLDRKTKQQAKGPDPDVIRKLQHISGPGLVIWGGTVTFAAVDWCMSLEPHWFSTLYGLMFMVGGVLTTLAFCVVIIERIRDHSDLGRVAGEGAFHDLGNLILAFVMLWGYLTVSQYLIIWSANLPEEITWYIKRSQGGWQYVAMFLVVFHFALPFSLLLARANKRSGERLRRLAFAILAVHIIEVFWLIVPAFHHGTHGLNVTWTDPLAIIAIGGIWTAIFASNLASRPLLTVGDPRLEEALNPGEALEHG